MKKIIVICLILVALIVSLPVLVTEIWLYKTGEAWQEGRFVDARKGGQEVYYNPDLNNVTLPLKFKGYMALDTDVIVYGNSRVNQFRAGMFAPYSFYNMGNVSVSPNSLVGFIEALPQERRPRVVIAIMEPFVFRAGPRSADIDLNMISTEQWTRWPIKRPAVWKKTWIAWRADSEIIAWYKSAQLESARLLGGRAIDSGRGTRGSDGAVFWGRHHDRTPAAQLRTLENYQARTAQLMDAKDMFSGFEYGLSPEIFDDLRAVQARLGELGVQLVGITPPLGRAIQDRLDGDAQNYALWNEMQTEDFEAELNAIFPYYNFSRFERFGGDETMIMDAIHPSESAAALMLAYMSENGIIAEVFPDIDAQILREKVRQAPSVTASLYDDEKIEGAQ